MLLPAVTLIGYYFIGPTVYTGQLRSTAKFSVYALSTTFVFRIAFYYAQTIMNDCIDRYY